ncbi:hypothetical protein QFC24_002150 [Naganishia onofrii]|uniref:Uncharacterized protein n=1 Tax=Naganishia onofrii TaxID=1851511 RepID=A0ACC2XRZ4_9TREE|nr:hypothetical protein QFC24_002150 [Naganishia onofrii]
MITDRSLFTSSYALYTVTSPGGPLTSREISWQEFYVLQSALIPGNRNADNIAEAFPGLMTSFGFGQVGSQVAVAQPRYLLASLQSSQYDRYAQLRSERQLAAHSRMTSALVNKNLVQIKEAPPYTPELEESALLNPLARASAAKGSFAFINKMPVAPQLNSGNTDVMKDIMSQAQGVLGVGHCPRFDASMKVIEILNSEAGPVVKFSGDAQTAAAGISVKVSISQSNPTVVAFAVEIARPDTLSVSRLTLDNAHVARLVRFVWLEACVLAEESQGGSKSDV